MPDRMGITFTVPAGVDPVPVYEAEGGIEVFETDDPYLLSDTKTLRAPVPVVDAEGPVWTDAAGNLQDALAISIIAPSLAALATAYLNGIAPYHFADYISNRMLYAGADVGNVTGGTGYSFARASVGTYVNADGTIRSFASGEMRRGDRGVLIEGERTNLLLRSQEFDNAAWTKSRSSVTANAAVAPDGTTTADKLVEDTATNTHRAFQSVAKAASAIQYTYSVFLKAAERTFAQVKISDSTEADSASVDVNLSTGAISAASASGFTGASATILAFANGWYRVTLTATTDSDTAVVGFCFIASALGTISYTGDGTSGLLVWGAQLEAGAFPSSYIPTTTASVTRAADVLTYTAGVGYPLTLWAEFERAVDTGAVEGILAADAGADSSQSLLYVSASDIFRAFLTNTTTQADVQAGGAVLVGAVVKGAARFSTDNVNAARDGTAGTVDTAATVPSNPTTLRIGRRAGISPCFGYIRRIAIINSAQNDANLQLMTAA